MRLPPAIIGVVIALLTGQTRPATAAIIILQPVEDAFTSSASPGSNYGGAGIANVASSALAKGGFSGVSMFDFASAKATLDSTYGAGNWTVQGVTMTMTITTASNAVFNSGTGAGDFKATWFDGAWIEGSGSPNTPSGTGINDTALNVFLAGSTDALGTFSYDGAISGTKVISFALSPQLLADLANGKAGSVAFTAADNTGAINMFFNSRSFGTAGARPFLSITAAPEPGRTAFLLLGLAVVTGRRRRVTCGS